MKRTLYVVFLIILFSNCHKDTTEDTPKSSCNFIDFRYYKGAKLYMGELSNSYILVAFNTTYSLTDIQKFISSVSDFDQNYHYKLYDNKLAALKFSNPKTCEEITGFISNLQKNSIVEFAYYTIKTDV